MKIEDKIYHYKKVNHFIDVVNMFCLYERIDKHYFGKDIKRIIIESYQNRTNYPNILFYFFIDTSEFNSNRIVYYSHILNLPYIYTEEFLDITEKVCKRIKGQDWLLETSNQYKKIDEEITDFSESLKI